MWYSADVFFESVHNGKSSRKGLWEETIVLIHSQTERSARQKAEQWAKRAEHEYVSANGDRVRWVFRCVERVAPIEADGLVHGVELFSRFLKAKEVRSILSKIEFPEARTKSKSA